jgi:hypothetical protein
VIVGITKSENDTRREMRWTDSSWSRLSFSSVWLIVRFVNVGVDVNYSGSEPRRESGVGAGGNAVTMAGAGGGRHVANQPIVFLFRARLRLPSGPAATRGRTLVVICAISSWGSGLRAGGICRLGGGLAPKEGHVHAKSDTTRTI